MAKLTRSRAILAGSAAAGVLAAAFITWPASEQARTQTSINNATADLIAAVPAVKDEAAREWLRRIPAKPSSGTAASIAKVATESGMTDVEVNVGTSTTKSVDTFAGVVPVTVSEYTLTGTADVNTVAVFLSAVSEITPMVTVASAQFNPTTLRLVTYTAPIQASVEALK